MVNVPKGPNQRKGAAMQQTRDENRWTVVRVAVVFGLYLLLYGGFWFIIPTTPSSVQASIPPITEVTPKEDLVDNEEFIRASYDIEPPEILPSNMYEEFVLRMFQDNMVSYKDYQCYVRAIYYEAGIEDVMGKIAVANVIAHRAKRQGKSICGVVGTSFIGAVVGEQIGKECHYDCPPGAVRKKVTLLGSKGQPLDDEYKRLWHSARIAYDAMTNRLPDIAPGATHYWNPKILLEWYKIENPSWAKKLALLKNQYTMNKGMIGNHRFAIEK
jgi:hypothetical protein